jgi:hypothetical protein
MSALAALTPPFLVCAVVIAAIVAFLRHEMGRGRQDRGVDPDDNSGPAPTAADGQDEGAGSDASAAASVRRDD